MRIEYLREFGAIARHLNMRAAAEELHITQSTLSKHLMDLERETRLHLADRGPFGVVLTNAGEAFATESSYVVASYESMVERCRNLQKRQMRVIKVQELLQNSVMGKLYQLARKFQAERPDLNVGFKTTPTGNAVRTFEKNDDLNIAIDMYFDSTMSQIEDMRANGFRVEAIATTSIICWFQLDNGRIPRNRKLLFDDLVDLPIITSSGEIFDYFGFALRCLFEQRGATPLFRTVPLGDTPTDYFLQDFGSSVLLTTDSMADDPRLGMRDDIAYAEIDESDFHAVFYAVCRESDVDAMGFVDFIVSHSS